MWLRQAFFRWLIPSAFLLPLWLLIGWGVFNAGGWAFLWVLFIAIPSVFIGQLILTLLVRARPSVRLERAVSWWDVAGFTVWHGLTIAVGFYPEAWFGLLLTGAIAAAIGMFWLMLWQMWCEAKGAGGMGFRQMSWSALRTGAPRAPAPDVDEVLIIRESRRDEQ